MQINDYNVNNESSFIYLTRIQDNPIFKEIYPETDEYRYVSTMITESFNHSKPVGRDARNLTHTSLAVSLTVMVITWSPE